MPKKSKKYIFGLNESLKVPKEAEAYLNAHLDEKGPQAEELFLMALRDVAQAHGISEISNKTKLGRESLYKTLSKKGNPKFSTLNSLLNAMGLEICIVRRKAS